ncbi:MAG: hypothetical protein WCG42_04630, partial [Parachlamydiaceae bacterium]
TNTAPINFKVYQQDYAFSTVFELSSNEGIFGNVCKSSFRIRTNYDLYNQRGDCEAIGICRVLTLGVIYSWATEIDIYDINNQYVGMIDGQVVTGSGAKFSIYDLFGNRTGIAYLDRTFASFTIVHPDNESFILASFKRVFIENTIDHWDVTIYEKEAIDVRILKIFAAFAVDSQEHFKEDK